MQARMGSTRLPGKVMKLLSGKPVLLHDIIRCRAARKIDDVIIATSTNPEDTLIETACAEWGVACGRGSSEDVLSRYFDIATQFGSEVIVRVTSDCPLIDPNIIDLVIHKLEDNDYVTNIFDRNFPRGMDTEVFTFASLEKAHRAATTTFDREHVTPYLRAHSGTLFKTQNVSMPNEYHYPQFRLTLDTQEDYELFKVLYDTFYKEGELISVPDVLHWLTTHPEVSALNSNVPQKTR